MKEINRLKIIKIITKDKRKYCLCKCICGKKVIIREDSIKSKTTKSCGCLRKERMTTHGMRKTRIYQTWLNMEDRCNNKNNKNYNRYGNRGIKCLWKSFENFKNDMYESYLKHCKTFGEHLTTLDRIDNNGNYCKENCRWATPKEQANNTRKNVFITFNKQTKSLVQWSNELNISTDTIQARLKYLNWSIKKTLTTKPYAKNKNNLRDK